MLRRVDLLVRYAVGATMTFNVALRAFVNVVGARGCTMIHFCAHRTRPPAPTHGAVLLMPRLSAGTAPAVAATGAWQHILLDCLSITVLCYHLICARLALAPTPSRCLSCNRQGRLANSRGAIRGKDFVKAARAVTSVRLTSLHLLLDARWV